jgi:DNA helicase-2/ATP-dependent DNA helicase PcrA
VASQELRTIFGPPGTGKTTRLLGIMEEELARGVEPGRLAYLSFTTAARREAVTRATERFSLKETELPFFRTLHSIAYRALGMRHRAMIKSTRDLSDFSRLFGMEFTVRQAGEDALTGDMYGQRQGDRLLALDHYRRHRRLTPEEAFRQWPEFDNWWAVKRFVDGYAAWKTVKEMFDFTDLLERAHEPLPVDVVIVDEAQDLSDLQWVVLDAFARRAARVYVAGDDDQAIYTWAGASPEAFVQRSHAGAVEVLGKSYRLPQAVFELAQSLVLPIHDRQPKEWSPREEKGRVQSVMDVDQVEFGQDGTYLVLYRNHYLAGEMETRLRQAGLPYAKQDHPAPGAEWGAAIVYWERLRKGQTLTQGQALEVYGAMALGSQLERGAKALLEESDEATFTLGILVERYGLRANPEDPWFLALGKISDEEGQYLRQVLRHFGAKALTEQPRIRLSTIHAAKGAEADHVVLLSGMSRKVMESIEKNPDAERRVFYVGATRAKHTLTVVGLDNPLFSI